MIDKLSRIRLSTFALAVFALTTGRGAFADELEVHRIGARTNRPLSTIEARGTLRVDDPVAFMNSLETNGVSVQFEYTAEVSDFGYADGDIIPNTPFTWDSLHCTASSDASAAKCNDKSQRTYLRMSTMKKAPPTTYRWKAYVRQIQPELSVTPNFGESLRFVMDWTDIDSGPRTIEGVADRCDWKRGPQRTTKHIKCPTLCGGSPKAVCGSSYCEASDRCN